jgi:nitroreductase/dihydropteridine reductase
MCHSFLSKIDSLALECTVESGVFFLLIFMSVYNDHLNWRYATKKFDASKKLSDEQLNDLLESARLAASSYGLQPYKVAVVTNPDIRKKIQEHAWGQTQIVDASHLLVFCAKKTMDEAYVDQFIALVAKERGMTPEALQGYRDMMVGTVKGRTPEMLADWNKRQAYIAVGFLLSAAAQMEIDACPMEGFDPAHVDVDLGIVEDDLTSVVCVPVGFRAADDATASYKKVRWPKEEFFMFKN